MQLVVCWSLLVLLHVCAGQTASEDDLDDRRLHKHKKRRPGYQQDSPYQRPCFGRSDGAAVDGDGRSLLAALGGAAVGYKFGASHQQPVIHNNIYNGVGGGSPCGVGYSGAQSYGGSVLGPLLASSLTGSRHGGVNWDRTVRQFERQVVRPLTRWW